MCCNALVAAFSKGELARGAQRSCNVGCAGNQSPCRYVNRRNPTARGSSALDTAGWTERRTDIFTAAFVRLQGVKLVLDSIILVALPHCPSLWQNNMFGKSLDTITSICGQAWSSPTRLMLVLVVSICGAGKQWQRATVLMADFRHKSMQPSLAAVTAQH